MEPRSEDKATDKRDTGSQSASPPESGTSPPVPSPEEIVRVYGPKVYNLARRILGSETDAEDVTQDVLLKVIESLHQFRGEAALGTWLHRITVNAALAYRKKRARQEETESTAHKEPLEEFPEQSGHGKRLSLGAGRPEGDVLSQEAQQLIEKAIAELPENYRVVYVLADVEGLSNAEIADILELNIPAVKSRLHRARLMMRQKLQPYFEELNP